MVRRVQTFRQFLREDEAEKAKKTVDFLKNKHSSGKYEPGHYYAFKPVGVNIDSSMSQHLVDKSNSQDWLHGYERPDQGPPWRKTFNPVHHAIDAIANMDPHPKKAHTEWLVNKWQNGSFKHEDGPRVKETLTKFMAHKKELGNTTIIALPKNQKGSDINAFGGLNHLENHMDKHLGVKHKNTDFSHPDAPLIHDADGIKIHELQSKEASTHTRSCFDNKWCTARDDRHNMHDAYASTGTLYHMHMPDNTHWQLHVGTSKADEPYQLADHNDVMHPIKDFVKKYPDITKMPHNDKTYNLKSLRSENRDYPLKSKAEKEAHAASRLQDLQSGIKPSEGMLHDIARFGSHEHLKQLKSTVKNHENITHHDKETTNNITNMRLETEFGHKSPQHSNLGSEDHMLHLIKKHDKHYEEYNSDGLTGPVTEWHGEKANELNREFKQHFSHIIPDEHKKDFHIDSLDKSTAKDWYKQKK